MELKCPNPNCDGEHFVRAPSSEWQWCRKCETWYTTVQIITQQIEEIEVESVG